LENIYLYKPVAHKYIEYHYYISSSRAIHFKSSYMVKIIDYGRSFFRDDKFSPVNSKTLYDTELCGSAKDCNVPEVTGTCGSKVGFGWLKKFGAKPADDFYICSQKRNMSHDLLPLTRIRENNAKINTLTPDLNTLLKRVLYTDYYGTAELVDTVYKDGKTIYNVQDAADFIMEYVDSKKYKDQNEAAYAAHGYQKLGDLHVFMNGFPMIFEPFLTHL
jgi:hypothetical protein